MDLRCLNLRQWSGSMSSMDLTYFGIRSGSRASAIPAQLTPSSADRLHYSQGLLGGGLETYGA